MSSLNKGLILHHTMDSADTDNGKVRDSSALDNHGTINDGVTTGKTDSPIGEACEFNGTDGWILGNQNLGIEGDAEFTMSAWIKWTGDAWVSDYSSFMGNNSTDSPNIGLSFTVNNGRPAIDFWNNRWRVDDALEVKKWYHICGIKTSGVISNTSTIYINGKEVSGSVENDDLAPNITDKPPVIGRLEDVTERYFQGIIADARFYNRALSSQEVNRLYQQRTQANIQAQSGSGISGIQAHWPLGGDTAEDVVGDNDGTLQNGVTTGVQSPTGKGMGFDGSNDEISTGEKVFDPNESFTVAAWFYPIGGRGGIVKHEGGGYFYLGPGSDTVVGFTLSDDDGNSFSPPGHPYSSRWTHYVGVSDRSSDTMYMYVDGNFYGDKDISSLGTITSENFVMGRREPGRNYEGKLDDVRVYDRALSQAEIRSIYDQGLPAPESGLEGWWTMDTDDYDSGSDTIADQSGNGNTGTLIGGTSTGLDGKIGESFEFNDSDSGIDTGIQALTPPITISAWANLDVTGEVDMVFSNFVSGSDDLYIQQNGDNWQFTHDAGGVASGLGTTSKKEWQHLVMTLDGTNLIAYVDGAEAGRESDTSTATIDNGTNFHIGIAGDQATNPFGGKIDDVRIYDRALSESEIRKLYRSTAPYYKNETSDGTSSRNIVTRGTRSLFLGETQMFRDRVVSEDGEIEDGALRGLYDPIIQQAKDDGWYSDLAFFGAGSAVEDVSGNVATMFDASGNKNDAIQGTSSQRPTLEKNTGLGHWGGRGDADDDVMLAPVDFRGVSYPDVSIFLVTEINTISQKRIFFGNDDGNFDRFNSLGGNFVGSTEDDDFTVSDGSGAITVLDTPSVGDKYVVSNRMQNAKTNGSYVRINGVNELTYTGDWSGDDARPDLSIWASGGGNHTNHTIATMIVIQKGLSESLAANVEDILTSFYTI